MKKPFPAKVNWLAAWKYRWLVLDMINQIAHGGCFDAMNMASSYGASKSWGNALYYAAQEIIVKDKA